MTAPPGWKALLRKGEDILWQGRPNPRVTIDDYDPLQVLGGLLVAVLAGVTLLTDAWPAAADPDTALILRAGYPAICAGFVLAGLFIAFGIPHARARRYRHTWYTLTNRRAFIATDIPGKGKDIRSYPIDGAMQISHQPLSSSVHFASRTGTSKYGSHEIPFGFEKISDAREVFRMMRELQRNRGGTRP